MRDLENQGLSPQKQTGVAWELLPTVNARGVQALISPSTSSSGTLICIAINLGEDLKIDFYGISGAWPKDSLIALIRRRISLASFN